MHKTIATYLALILLALCCSAPLRADLGELSESQVKAAYLFNFAKFVEWPASAFRAPAAPLVIGIVGRGAGDPFEALSGRQAKGRRVQVRQLQRPDEVAGCQILYIPASEKARVKELLRGVPASGILTVSDIRNFCAMGGMIGLVTRGDKVQFEINLGGAERAGLRLSSQMLKLAVNVVN